MLHEKVFDGLAGAYGKGTADLLHEGTVGMLLGSLGGSVDLAQMGYGATDGATVSRQINSYTDAVREMQSEQNTAAFTARYKELDRKYLDGSITGDKKKMNYQWEHKVMRTLNEIDAQKYLITVADKYKIPLKEREETRALLRKYEEELEQLRKDGSYYD